MVPRVARGGVEVPNRGSQSKWRRGSEKACLLWVRKVQVGSAGAPSQLGLVGSFVDRNRRASGLPSVHCMVQTLLGPAGLAQSEREH